MYTDSYTESWSSTFSEARVRAVMQKVLSDLIVLLHSGIQGSEGVHEWHETLTFLLLHEAAARFQIQFRLPSGASLAIEYVVSDDGTLSEDADSGGIDYYSLPAGTRVSLTIRLRESYRERASILKYLTDHGWGFGGSMVEGTATRGRAYSKNGFGLIRTTLGDWT